MSPPTAANKPPVTENNLQPIEGKWTGEVEEILEKLRINCVNLSEYHRRRYYHYKGYGKYFRIPIILLASINSTASVGLQPVLEQQIISGITCLIGMIMGILGAIELYLGIQSSMELCLSNSKAFYSLGIDIFKTLSLRRENRSENGKDYLNQKYAHYVKIMEGSNLLKRKMRIDMLANVAHKFEDYSQTHKRNIQLDDDSEPMLKPLYKLPRQSISISAKKSFDIANDTAEDFIDDIEDDIPLQNESYMSVPLPHIPESTKLPVIQEDTTPVQDSQIESQPKPKNTNNQSKNRKFRPQPASKQETTPDNKSDDINDIV